VWNPVVSCHLANVLSVGRYVTPINQNGSKHAMPDETKPLFPVPPPVTVKLRGTKTEITIGGMTVYCSYNTPIAFKRGKIEKRVAGVLSATMLHHLSTLGVKRFDLLEASEFSAQLAGNLKAALRNLSDGYDIVHESKYYADVITKTLTQLDYVIGLEWDSVASMREALQQTRDFLFERLILLINASTEERHITIMSEISLQSLQQIINAGHLEPTEGANPNGLPIKDREEHEDDQRSST